MLKTVKMDLEYMGYIPGPPFEPKQLYRNACSNDDITINSWKDQWISQTQENHKKYGPWAEHNIGRLHDSLPLGTAICAGSGPSLENNIEVLSKASKHKLPIVSVLHNFHYMVDHDVDVKYYVSLDAGEVTIEEISEGGKYDHEYYLKQTEDKTLLAFIGSHPKLLESWRGRILFFNAPIPDPEITAEFDKIEPFNNFIGNGGNVLGAATYIAKTLGAVNIGFVGADFAFSYDKRFHPWPSKYDGKLGHSYRVIDIFGNSVHTWGSYQNFKNWFEYIAISCPGIWVNCSEGGTLGAYPQGNIQQIIQMPLHRFADACVINQSNKWQMNNPSGGVDPEHNQHTLLF